MWGMRGSKFLFLSVNYAAQRCCGSDFKAKNKSHKGSYLRETEAESSYPATVSERCMASPSVLSQAAFWKVGGTCGRQTCRHSWNLPLPSTPALDTVLAGLGEWCHKPAPEAHTADLRLVQRPNAVSGKPTLGPSPSKYQITISQRPLYL